MSNIIRRIINSIKTSTDESDALFEQIALHIPVDTLGSRQRYLK